MEFIFYKLLDKPNKVNKVLENGLTLSLNMRKTSNLNSLFIRIKNDGFNISNYNYVSIPNLNRYYFIDELNEVGFGVWELNLELDYLETYSSEIMAANATYKREIKQGDYLETGLERSSKPEIELVSSDKGFDESTNSIVLVGV